MKRHTGFLIFATCMIFELLGFAETLSQMEKDMMEHQKKVARPENRQQGITSNRDIAVFISGNDDEAETPEWNNKFDICDENRWGTEVDRVTTGDHLFYVAIACTLVEPGPRSPTRFPFALSFHSGMPNVFPWPAGYFKDWSTPCGPNTFLVGVSLDFGPFRTYPGQQVKYVNYMCSTSNFWYYPRENNAGLGRPVPIPPSHEMHCPYATAICGIQVKAATFEGVNIITNLRIACCYGDVNNMGQFLRPGDPAFSLPQRPIGAELGVIAV